MTHLNLARPGRQPLWVLREGAKSLAAGTRQNRTSLARVVRTTTEVFGSAGFPNTALPQPIRRISMMWLCPRPRNREASRKAAASY